MTVNGFIRSYGAAVRRAEREQQRRAREAAKYFKQQQKELEIANATEASRQHEDYVLVLKSLHKDCSATIDWIHLYNEVAPQEPQPIIRQQKVAKQALENYQPGFLTKVFGFDKYKRQKLGQQVQEAIERDKKENQEKLRQYNKDYKDWSTLHAIAKGIGNKSIDSYKEAIQFFNPFVDIKEFGSKINLHLFTSHVVIDFSVKSTDVVPNYILAQTSTENYQKRIYQFRSFTNYIKIMSVA